MGRILLIVFIWASEIACGQVRHIVYDENHGPLEFANVLFYTADTTYVTGTVSGRNGVFTLPATGNYSLVKVSMIGYQSRWLHTPLPDSIFLKSTQTQLKGVIVKSASSIRLVGSSLFVDVQNSPFRNLGNADELLGKLPSVRAEEGVYSIFGKGVATIYVNNRRLRDNSELQRISPSDIATVEIVRNPGAGYDATIPAVIKIKLKRPASEGWGIQVSTYGRLGRRFSDAETVSLNYNTHPVNLFFEASNSSYRMNTDQTNLSDTYTGEGTWRMLSDMPRWDSNYYDYTLTGGADVQLSGEHQLGTRWSYTDDTSRYGGPTANTMFYNGLTYENLSALTASNSGYNQVMGNLFYTGQLTPQFDVTFNADFTRKNTTNSDATTEWGDLTPQHTNLNSGTADYTLWSGRLTSRWTVNKKLYFMFGGDGNVVSQNRTNYSYNNEEAYAASLLKSEDRNGALFVESGFSIDKLRVYAGLRYEVTMMDYRDAQSDKSLLDKTYRRFYPSASLSLPVGKADMSLSYTSKVGRPSFYQLRNGSEYFNRYLVTEGNPLLLPQYTSDLSYVVQYKSFNATVGWQRVKNYMQSENEIIDPNPLNVLRRPVNMPAYAGIYVNLAYDFRVGVWHPYLSANMTKTYFTVKRVSNNMPKLGKRPLMNFSFGNWFRFGTWSLYADILYDTNGYLREYQECARINFRMGLMKYFFKRSLYVSLQANNLFHARETEISHNSNEIFNKTRYKDNQTVSLYIRYTLKYKNKYKGMNSAQSEIDRM